MTTSARAARAPLASALSATLIALTLAPEARAADATKEACITANESAQALRRTGKLSEARTRLLACAAPSCPTVLRDDCVERLTNLEKAVPTIVLTARDDLGHDLSAIKVTMDGAPFADRLDGSALRVDPGEHAFELAAEGFRTVTLKLVLSEGVKGRQEMVTFQPLVPRPVTPPPSPPVDRPTTSASGGSGRTLAYVVGGAGIVALGVGGFFGLSAISKNHSAGCDADNVCTSSQARRDAQGMATIATVGFIAGAALVAGGVVLFLTSGGPSSGRASAATAWQAAPLLGAGTGGVSLQKEW